MIDFKLDPMVPNTPFYYIISPSANADSGKEIEDYEAIVYEAYYNAKQVNRFTEFPLRNVHWFTDKTPSGSYTIEARFGPNHMILAKAEMDFTIQNDENNVDDILRDKYLPDVLDIGTNWSHSKASKPTYTNDHNDPCYYFICKSGFFETFSPHGVKFWVIEFADPVQAQMYSVSKFKWDEHPLGQLSSQSKKHVYVNSIKLTGNWAADTVKFMGKGMYPLATNCTTVKGGGYWDANYDDLIKCHYEQFVVRVLPKAQYSEIGDVRILASETLKKLKSVSHESESVDTKPVAEKVSEPIQKASTECGKNHDYTFVDGMCTKKLEIQKKLGDKVYYDWDDVLKDIPNGSIHMKLIDPSGKIIQDKTSSGHNRISIEYPETGMVGDYETIIEAYSDGKLYYALRTIVSVVGEEQQSSRGCGEGTVLVNGVCQLAPTTKAKSTSMSIEPLYLIIGVVAIGGIIGAIAVARRGSKTPKPAKQDLDEYEEQYLAKQKPSRKPAEKKETSAICQNCGASLKPTAKFCGKCGNQV